MIINQGPDGFKIDDIAVEVSNDACGHLGASPNFVFDSFDDGLGPGLGFALVGPGGQVSNKSVKAKILVTLQ